MTRRPDVIVICCLAECREFHQAGGHPPESRVINGWRAGGGKEGGGAKTTEMTAQSGTRLLRVTHSPPSFILFPPSQKPTRDHDAPPPWGDRPPARPR